MKAIVISFAIILSSLVMNAQSSSSVFLPGIVSGDSIDFNACFLPDGSFLFSRSVARKTVILICRKSMDAWTAPQAVSFSTGAYSDADPAISPNGELYFISNRPVDKDDTTNDYNIWK